MKKEKQKERDPAWSRSRPNSTRKKQKMCSRSSLRLLSTLMRKKRAADSRRGVSDQTVCVTRTVELPATQTVGDESSKLLFMIALGLVPKTDVEKCQHSPFVRLERLDPVIEAEARARTMEKIFQIFQERKLELLQRRIYCVPPPPPVNVVNTENVELVDLVSSDEESEDSSSESDIEPIFMRETYYPSTVSHGRGVNSATLSNSTNHLRIISASAPRKPVFKSLANNQDSGVFRNWKPESMKKLINLSPPDTKNRFDECAGLQKKLLSSLKSILPSNPTFHSSKISSGSSKQNGHLEESSGISDITIPTQTTVITID